MGKGFLQPLRAELLSDRKTWRLLEPLTFADPVEGVIVVPAGTVTDFASTRLVRTIALVAGLLSALCAAVGLMFLSELAAGLMVVALVLYAAVNGYATAPAALHDYLYRTAKLPRPQCDAVMARAMRLTGDSRWRTAVMWAGVRVGGRRHYSRPGDQPD